jgi:chromosome segregation ATPase
MADAPPPNIKFPVKPSSAAPSLVLPRRRARPLELSEASVEARKQIAEIVSATRAPFGRDTTQLSNDQMETLQRSLRELEAKLAEREHAMADLEARLAERERDIAEAEALLAARESLLQAARQSAPAKTGLSTEEQAALEQLKTELDRQEASLKEQKAAVAERERFMEENEAKLFEKMMQQQEKETELEQREEDLRAREQRLREKGGSVDPHGVNAPAEPKKFDEFNE